MKDDGKSRDERNSSSDGEDSEDGEGESSEDDEEEEGEIAFQLDAPIPDPQQAEDSDARVRNIFQRTYESQNIFLVNSENKRFYIKMGFVYKIKFYEF